MASIIIGIGAAIYVTAEKIHDRKEKKRALKAQATLQHDFIEDVSLINDTKVRRQMETLPFYHQEPLPAYHKETLPAYHRENLSVSHG